MFDREIMQALESDNMTVRRNGLRLRLITVIERYGSHKTGLKEIEQLFLAAGWTPPPKDGRERRRGGCAT